MVRHVAIRHPAKTFDGEIEFPETNSKRTFVQSLAANLKHGSEYAKHIPGTIGKVAEGVGYIADYFD